MENNASGANGEGLAGAEVAGQAHQAWDLSITVLGLIRAAEIIFSQLGGEGQHREMSAVTAALGSAEDAARQLSVHLEEIESLAKKG